MKQLALIVILSALSGAAFANPLEGTWKTIGTVCSSGVARNEHQSETVRFQHETVITFGKTEAEVKSQVTYSIDPKVLFDLTKQYESKINEIEQLPESSAKQEQLIQAKEYLEQLLKFSDTHCEIEDKVSYRVDGDQLNTETLSSNSTCPHRVPPDRKSETASFTITNNILRVKSSEVETSTNNYCPQGDSMVSILEKIK